MIPLKIGVWGAVNGCESEAQGVRGRGGWDWNARSRRETFVCISGCPISQLFMLNLNVQKVKRIAKRFTRRE